jgi:hypothetical protein
MARRKKTFDCGHKGFGSYCHACRADQERADRDARHDARRRAERAAWTASFDRDPIDLRGLPRHVVEAAREKIAALEDGAKWQEVGGKKVGPSTISVPLPSWYRLVCLYDDGSVVPVDAMSHESYNTIDFV